ncbi:MAG: GreA/GreB family elongation factor [Opitutae bacterium]|nr:GreA/GreB family elongation factor [Opitutae bacterium]
MLPNCAGDRPVNKTAVHTKIIARLAAELELLTQTALATHAEATDEENKAEDKYDTRGLEASYLALGQSKQDEETALALQQFQSLALRDFARGEPISLGALVALEAGPARNYYFVGPRAGGTEVRDDGREVMVITPQSPLGRQLVGKKQGDPVQLELGGKRSEFRVAQVS